MVKLILGVLLLLPTLASGESQTGNTITVNVGSKDSCCKKQCNIPPKVYNKEVKTKVILKKVYIKSPPIIVYRDKIKVVYVDKKERVVIKPVVIKKHYKKSVSNKVYKKSHDYLSLLGAYRYDTKTTNIIGCDDCLTSSKSNSHNLGLGLLYQHAFESGFIGGLGITSENSALITIGVGL